MAVEKQCSMQYNNLIALFDNWDNMYLKALETSKTANGTLEEQNEIYKESLVAAKQQFETAKEELIGTLFNSDSFKGLYDFGTGFVHILNDIADSIGGLIPLVTVFVSTLLKGNQAKIGQFAANLKTNKMIDQQAIEQNQARKQLVEMFGNDLKIPDEAFNQMIQKRAEFLKYDELITDQQQEQLNYFFEQWKELQNQQEVLKENSNNYQKQLDALRESVKFTDKIKQDLEMAGYDLNTNDALIRGIKDQKAALEEQYEKTEKKVNLDTSGFHTTKTITKTVAPENTTPKSTVDIPDLEGVELRDYLRTLWEDASPDFDKIMEKAFEEKLHRPYNAKKDFGLFQELSQSLLQAENPKDIEALTVLFQKIKKNQTPSTPTTVSEEVTQFELGKAQKQIQNNLYGSGLWDALTLAANTDPNNRNTINHSIKSSLGQNIKRLNGITYDQEKQTYLDNNGKEIAQQKVEELVDHIMKKIAEALSFIDKDVKESLDEQINTAEGQKQGIEDNDLDAGNAEKEGIFSQMNKMLSSLQLGKEVETVANAIGTFGQTTSTAAMATSSLLDVGKNLKDLFNGEANAIETLTSTMTFLGTAATGVVSAIMGIAKAATALDKAMGIIGLIGGVLAAVIPLIAEWYDKTHVSEAEAAENLSNTITNLEQKVNDLKTAQEELAQTFQSYEDAKNKTQDLVKGTAEYKEAVDQANESAQALIDKYDLIGKYSIDENGIIQFDEGVIEDVQEQQQRDQYEKQIGLLTAQKTKAKNDYYKSEPDEFEAERDIDQFLQSYGKYDYVSKEVKDKLLSSDLSSKEEAKSYLVGLGIDEEVVEEFTSQLRSYTDALEDWESGEEDLNKTIDEYDRQIAMLSAQMTFGAETWSDLFDGNKEYAQKVNDAIGNLLADDAQNATADTTDLTNDISYTTDASGVNAVIGNFLDQHPEIDYKYVPKTYEGMVREIYGDDVEVVDENTIKVKNEEGQYEEQEINEEEIVQQFGQSVAGAIQEAALKRYFENQGKDSAEQIAEAFDTVFQKDKANNTNWLDLFLPIASGQAEKINTQGILDQFSISQLKSLRNQPTQNYAEQIGLDADMLDQLGYDTADTFNTMIQNAIDSVDMSTIRQKLSDEITAIQPVLESTITQAMSGEIDQEELFNNEDFQLMLQNLEDLKEQYPELASFVDIVNNKWLVGTEAYTNALIQVQDGLSQVKELTDMEDIEHMSDLLDRGLSNFDTQKTQDRLNALFDKTYTLTIDIETQALDEFDNFEDNLSNMVDLAKDFSKNFKVNPDQMVELGEKFPGILKNYKVLKDGTVQLDKEMVKSSMDRAAAEIEDSRTTTVTNLKLKKQELLGELDATNNTLEALIQYRENYNKDRATMDGVAARVSGIINDNLFDKIETDSDDLTNELGQDEKDKADNANKGANANQQAWIASYVSIAKASAALARIQQANNKAGAKDALPGDIVDDPSSITDTTTQTSTVKTNDAVSVDIPDGNGPKDTSNGSGPPGEEAPKQNKNNTTNSFTDANNNGIADNIEDAIGETVNLIDAKTTNGVINRGIKAVRQLKKRIQESIRSINARIASVNAQAESTIAGLKRVGMGDTFDYSKDKGSGKGNKGSKKDRERLKAAEDELNRLHDIGIEIFKIDQELEELERKAQHLYGDELTKNYENQIKLLNQRQKLEKDQLKIQEQEAKEQRKKTKGKGKHTVADYGFKFDEDGFITNYEDVYEKYYNRQEKLTNWYNNLPKKKQNKKNKRKVEKAEEDFQNMQEIVENYEQLTMEDIANTAKAIADDTEKAFELVITSIDQQFEEFVAKRDFKKYTHDLVKQYKDLERQLKPFSSETTIEDYKKQAFTVRKDIKNTLTSEQTTELEKLINDYNTAQVDGVALTPEEKNEKYQSILNIGEEDLQSLASAKEEIDSLQKEIIDKAINYLTDELESAFSDVRDSLDNEKSLIETLYGEDSFARLKPYYEEMHQLDLNEVNAKKKALDTAKQAYEEYLKDPYATQEGKEALEQNLKNAETTFRESITRTAQTVADEYSNAIKSIFKTLEDELTNGFGLDYFQEQWELINKQSERYLDDVNSAYEIKKLENAYQKSIEESEDSNAQRRLNKVMKEQLKMLREKDKLSQYDIDRANKMYELTLKQIALEDSQYNKTKMRLRRDSSGNYSYQFVADEDKTNELLQEEETLKNDIYNLDKERYNSTLEDIYNYYSEWQQAISDLYADPDLDDETRLAKAEEINKRYGDLINDAVADNKEAYDALGGSAFDAYSLLGENAENVANMSEEEKDKFLHELVPQMNSGYANLAKNFEDGGFFGIATKTLQDLVSYSDKFIYDINEISRYAQEDITDTDTYFDGMRDKVNDTTTAADGLINKFSEFTKAITDPEGDFYLACKDLDEKLTHIKELFEAAGISIEDFYNISDKNETSTSAGTGENTEQQPTAENTNSDKTSWAVGEQVAIKEGTPVGKDAYVEPPNNKKGKWWTPKYKKTQHDVIATVKDKNGPVYHVTWTDSHSNIHHAWFDLLNLKRNGYIKGFASGGYTGSWIGDSGRLALVHSKELILNKKDTKNILSAVKIVRGVNDMLQNATANAFRGVSGYGMFTGNLGTNAIDQNVHIQAEFPNVHDAREIERALSNLVNVASQRAFNAQR